VFFGKARPEVGQRNNCNKVPSSYTTKILGGSYESKKILKHPFVLVATL
jgi:hypothetical protein